MRRSMDRFRLVRDGTGVAQSAGSRPSWLAGLERLADNLRVGTHLGIVDVEATGADIPADQPFAYRRFGSYHQHRSATVQWLHWAARWGVARHASRASRLVSSEGGIAVVVFNGVLWAA